MKNLLKLSALAVALVASATYASADTLQLGSYGTESSNMGNANSAMAFSNMAVAPVTPYTGGAFGAFTTQTGPSGTGTSTVNLLGVTPTWEAAQTNSSWVSFGQTGPATSQANQPGGNFSPNGNYFFSSTFNMNTVGPDSGMLTVLADDTVTVFLNGHQLNTPTAPGMYSHCSDGFPTCHLTPTLVTLNNADYLNGMNTLTFQVTQGGSFDMGVDFSGSTVPEPSTLMMLGTGLLGSAGALFRRMRS